MIKTISKKKKCKKAKWLSEEALQIAEKRKEAKGKARNEKIYPFKCDPMDYSPPGSSIHQIFQARVLQ